MAKRIELTPAQAEMADSYRTSCCKDDPYRVGRAKYVCCDCRRDVSMEYMMFMEAVLNSDEE